MTNEALRLTADRMQHATDGLNALLALVPRDAGDPLPPPIVKFADESRDEVVARLQLPKESPACVITIDGGAVINDNVVQEIGDVDATVVVAISVDENESAEGSRNAGYYLRALAWVVRRWIKQDVNSTARKRNNVALLSIGRCELSPAFKQLEDRVIIGAMRIPMTLRDLAPA